MTENLMGTLARELVRVSAKRERWKGYAKDSGERISYELSLEMMRYALDQAVNAIGSNDIGLCVTALANLRGFDSDD